MKEHEIKPIEGSAIARAFRRPDSEVLTCASCGYRLEARQTSREGGGIGPDMAWRHYAGMPGRDARGHIVDCVESVHRISLEPAEA